MDKPIKKLSRKSLYKTPWFEFVEDIIERKGKKEPHAVLIMPKGISILPMDEKGNVYLVRQYRYAAEEYEIATVSGGIDKEETPIEGAERELKEELGITAKEIIDLGIVWPFTESVYCPTYIFLAKGLTFGKHDRESTEDIKTVKISLEKAVEMVQNSEIHHAQSCVLILKSYLYLNKTK